MKDLIERLEKAAGPDRELDALILVTARVGWSDRQYWNWRGCLPKGKEPTEIGYALDRAKSYTSSIDAALTLVPEGLYWQIGYGKLSPDEPLGGAAIFDPEDDEEAIADGEGETPAIALCIAALKARSAL